MRIPPHLARIGALGTLLVGGPGLAQAQPAPSPAAVGDICSTRLPPEAHDTLDLIERAGPHPYPQDGGVFFNREGILPSQQTGYYHEYTVETPGSPDRGAADRDR